MHSHLDYVSPIEFELQRALRKELSLLTLPSELERLGSGASMTHARELRRNPLAELTAQNVNRLLRTTE